MEKPAEPEAASLLDRLIEGGAIPVAQYMEEANRVYYGSRDPLGRGGDFITAPEISQMFGELVGAWLADLWIRADRPEDVRYVELGPGRGTLAADALRVLARAGCRPRVHFVETSAVLRAEQAKRVAGATWHEEIGSLDREGPLLVVANEFFDALPARQLVAGAGGWRERVVTWQHGRLVPEAGPTVAAELVPVALRTAPAGTIFETSPASQQIARGLAARLAAQGGAALIVDYGHERSGPGETLQAVARHAFADPWEKPGTRDLTVHVDFEALLAAARGLVRVHGPRDQGAWLGALGLAQRAEALAAAQPDRRGEIEAAAVRLASVAGMGRLFKVAALIAPGWPAPAGLE